MNHDKNIVEVMKSALLYLRVSSEDQVKNFSLDSQEQVCIAEAGRRGYEVLKIYREEGKSAKTMDDRPELAALLNNCRQNPKEISVVIAYRIDRLSRNTIDFLKIRSDLAKLGIQILSATEPSGMSPTEQAVETILAVFGQLENEIRSERARNGLRQRFLQGYGTKCPMGYKMIKKDNKRVPDVDETTFSQVKRIWDLMLTGKFTLRTLANELFRLNFFVLYNGKQYKFKHQTLGKLFNNKFYMGTLTSSRYSDEVLGKHQPMVTEEEYYQVQAIIQGRLRAGMKLAKSKESEDFPLRRMLVCECGTTMSSGWCKGRSKKYPLYWCPNPEHKIHSINTYKLDEMITEFLSKLKLKTKALDLFCEIVKEVYQSELSEYDTALAKSQKKIKEIKDLRLEVGFKHAKGIYSDEMFLEMNKVIETDLTVANVVHSEQKIEKIDIETLMDFAKSLFSNLAKAYEASNAMQKKLLIGSILLEPPVYSEDGILNRQFSPLYQAIQTFSKPNVLFSRGERT